MATVLGPLKENTRRYSAAELAASGEFVYVRNVSSGKLRLVTPEGLFDLENGKLATTRNGQYAEYTPLKKGEHITIEV
jgi:hypothetical protein